MRYLKRLLVGIYCFLGAFSLICAVIFAVSGNEPTVLIGCVFGAAGIESILGVIIKTKEKENGDNCSKS